MTALGSHATPAHPELVEGCCPTFTPTPRQLHLLRFIAGHIEARGGISPTVRQCAAGIGDRGHGNAYRMLIELERRGLIRRLHGRQQAIEVLHPVPIPRAPDGAPMHLVILPAMENRP